MKLLLRIALALVAPALALAQVRDIQELGAIGDGKVLNTQVIQRVIDETAASGGGEVRVPAGTFLTGTLLMKSKIVLRLMPGAVLQGSPDLAAYPEHEISAHQKFGTIIHDGSFVQAMRALIIADGAENVGIVGEGTVRGAGEAEAFQLGVNKEGKPLNLLLIGCRDVKLHGILVSNSAQVTISISDCNRVQVDGLRVHSVTNFNCDGVDVDARDVTIANCTIESEDDALCFKSEYLERFCENIAVQNCVIASACNGIKFGTGSRTGFRNAVVSNCVIRRLREHAVLHPGQVARLPEVGLDPATASVLTGLAIQAVDGGAVENIRCANLVMTDVVSPIFIGVGRRFLNPEGKPSTMQNVSIDHITAYTRSMIPSIIAGLDDSPVRDVRVSDVRVTVPIGATAEMLKDFPEQPKENTAGYPENRMTFGPRLPASAFYVRHAEQITLRDIVPEEARPAILTDDVRGLRAKDFRFNGRVLETPAVRQLASKDIEVKP